MHSLISFQCQMFYFNMEKNERGRDYIHSWMQDMIGNSLEIILDAELGLGGEDNIVSF